MGDDRGWCLGAAQRAVGALAACFCAVLPSGPANAEPSGGSDSAQGARGESYDVTAGLAWLRPELRASSAQLAGLAKLDELPLYDFELRVDPGQGTFSLRERITLTNLDAAPRSEWLFRLDANAGQPAARVVMQSGRCLDLDCKVLAQSSTLIDVTTKTPVAAHGRVRVELELKGTLERIDAARTSMLAQSLEGLAALGGAKVGGSYGLIAEGEGVVSLANFYAVLARRRGSDWDRSEPKPIGDLGSDDLANVHAVVDLPESYHLVHNGVRLRRNVDANTQRARTEIGAALVRDFVVLAGPALASASAAAGGVIVTSHFLSADRAAGVHVLDVATHALGEFERRFGPYPYVRLDVVEAPLVGGAGGVEFSGLVTVASMFYRGAPSFLGIKLMGSLDGMREFVTAHEVAHQWWHVLVGSDSRQTPFTDESLTQYSAIVYLEGRYGKERALREGDTNVKMNYQMLRMLGQPDGPVDAPVDAFPSTLAYGGLVYGKGPYFYREARALLGDAAFFRALRAYASQYRFRIAPAYALVDRLAASGQELKVRMLARHWLHEAHGDEDLGQAQGLLGLLGAGAGAAGGAEAGGGLGDGMDLDGLLSGLADGKSPGPGLPDVAANPQLQELMQKLLKELAKDGLP